MTEPTIHKTVIEAGVNDHIFIQIKQPGRKTVSLDLMEGGMSVRSDGYYVASLLTDVEWIGYRGDTQLLNRYCSWCGEELDLISSTHHSCKPRQK